MDDDYDNYVPQISTMDYSLLQQGGGAAGGTSTGTTGQPFLFDSGGQAPPPAHHSGRPPGCFAGMPGGHPVPPQQQYTASSGEFGGGMPAQAYPPGFCVPSMAAHMQIHHRQQQPPMGGAHGQPFEPSAVMARFGGVMPKLPPSMMAQQQQQSGTGTKTKAKKSKKTAATSATEGSSGGGAATVAEQAAGMMASASQQILPPEQYQMGYYYKGQGPPAGMLPSGHAEMMAHTAARSGGPPPSMDDQQKQQQQHFQQAQHQMFQQQYAQQQQQPPQGMYAQAAAAGQAQQSHFVGYGLQQQQQAKAAAAAAKASAQQIQQLKSAAPPGGQTAQQQQYNLQQQQQQQMFFAGQQQQQPYQQQHIQQPQAAAGQYPVMNMPSQGPGYPPMQYPTPDYPQQMAMQRQAYYAQQQMMAAGGGVPTPSAGPIPAGGGSSATSSFYHQSYMNQQQQQQQQQYIVQQQQQHIYRELFECDQQLSAVMPQAQQNAEAAMRAEKLQMHRGYLQSQLIQLQQHAAAAMASTITTPPSTAGMPMPPPASADMAPLSNSSRVPQLPQQQQFMGGQQTAQYTLGTYNTVQQQQQQQQPVHLSAQQQQDVPLTPAQQKLQPSSTQSSALPYGAGTTASYPPTPQATATVGFHSPGSGGTQQHPPSSGMMSQPQLQAAAQQTAGQPQHQAPHFTSQHLASPSVAVMSASNQVQVNIRPEVPGRTLISVYHSQDMPPTVVSTSAAMQSPYSVPPASDVSAAAMAQSLAMVKDSIPPEPVPSNIVQEQKRRQLLLQQQQQQRDEEQQLELQQQQFQKALHSSTMSRKIALPPPPHLHSPISPIQTRDDEAVQEVQQQERQKGAAMAAAAFRQRSHTSGMPQQLQEPVEQLQHRQPHQMQQPKPFWPSRAKSPEPMARHQQSHDQQVAMLKVPTPPSPIVRAPPIKLVDYCMLSCQFMAEPMAFETCRFVWPIGLKESVMETVRVLEKKKEVQMAELDGIDQSKDVGKQADDVGTFEAVLSPKMETPTTELIVQNEESLNTLDLSHNEKMPSSEMNAMAEQEDAEMNVEPKSIESRVPDEEVEMATEEPSIDTEPEAALTLSMSDTCLNRQDDKESAVDDSPWPEVSTKETTPMDVEEQLSFSVKHQQSSSTTSSLAYAFVGGPSSSSKGSAKQQRNKKRKLDWNRRDEDDDYVSRSKSTRAVPSSSKRRARREAVGTDVDEEDGTAMMAALDAQMLLVEKRRSTRKVTGEKKAKYGVDSDDDADGGGANGQKAPKAAVKMQQQPPQLVELEEKIVDKILGVRIGKRKVMKNKGGVKKEKKDDKEEEMPIGQQKEKEEKSGGKGEEEEEKEEKKETKKEEEEGDKGEEASSMKETPEEEAKEEEVEMEEVEVEELYAKYKNYSYLHCEWKTLEELEEMGNKRALTKLNRYKQKGGETTTIAGEDDEQEYFNEDYTVVSRILDETYDEQEQQHYVFVKWRGLSYDDCTWELIQNVPAQKVEEFRQRSIFDPCKAREQPDRRLSAAEFGQLAVPKDKVYKNDNMLREYQHEGVNWLLWTWTNGRNCILADEMGLGKTVQSIAFFQSLYDTGIHGPFLVVVPLSTLSNWEREFENWTNINVVVYHGVALSRQIIQNYEFYYKKSDRRRVIKFDAMITTYEVVVQDVEVLRKINFRVCVIDEAHRLKNRNCKLLQTGLLSLKMDYRVLLTGTPLQNNIQELFSLLNFLEPEQFGNSEAFLQQFGQCQTEDQVQKLQEILKPMMLRRLKEDVEKELQPKEETIIEVQLSNIQKKYYRAVLERNFTHLMKGTTPSLISLNNTMMQLRKCCNHPYLINGAEEQILSEVKQSHPDKMEEEIQAMALISSSGKLVLIDKLLPKLHADGHKVLIFSQMVRVLDLLEEYLNIKGYPFERIDGNIRGNDRQAAIDRFSRPDSYDRFVFLLCTRAGGLGINLTTADTVVLFDSDWNPQNDLQAQARCHRIGQTKPVKIYRLITANSYEREMFDKASLKLGLDKAVLQSMLNNKGENNQQMSRQEVEDLLRKGAYGAIMDDNEGTKFSEEDIDTILLRRTQTIRLEPGVKGSTFAKASFTSSHNREDITIQDPDFWSKWARKANIDVNSLNDEFSTKHLIVHEPRARKKRFEAENFKGTSESGDDGCSDEDDRSQSTPGPGTSKIAEGVKSRSSKRRRRGAAVGAGGEDDEDYPYKPDELAFNKTSYFKVEKLLAQFGWGRWVMLKAFSDLTEHELEHITRTLLLHCVREFRGDEKVREYVWNLITPPHGTSKSIKTEEKKTTPTAADSNSRYHQGWAALPEYNPPFICVDASFQRHLHRHSNKILNRIQQLHFLHSNVVTTTHQSKTAEDAGNGTTAVADGYELKMELPETLDKWLIMSSWDRLCDRDLLIGVHKHGMENWEQVRADDKLCYTQKNIHFPNTLDLNNRFKYLISVLQRSAELAAKSANAPEASIVEWTKVEESDFMRILRNYGVKDDTNSQNVINWGRFRELSICLHKKTDKELLEMLYCVLAMCTCVQSGHEGLSAMDEGRAERVDAISAKAGEKLMNRLHLMRKVHAIITMGIQNIRGMLKMVALDVMPKGWTEAHDEHLLIVVDKFGLEDIHGKVKLLPKLFESVGPIDEHMLLRRVVEICLTLETGKWSGPASIDMLQEDSHQTPQQHQHLLPSTSGAAQQQQQAAGANARNSTTAPKTSATAGNGRKKLDQPTTTRKGNGQQQQTATTVDKSKVISTPSITFNEQQALIKMMEQMSNPNYLLSLMSLMNPTAAMSGTNGSSSTTAASSTAALQQHFQQLQTLLSLSALSGGAIVDPTLASLSASLAALTGGNSTTPSSGKLPPLSAGSNSGGGSSVITTTAAAASESATKMDALNLSKRNTQEDRTPMSKASKATPSKGTVASKSMPTSGCGPSQIGTLSSTSSSSTSKQQHCSSSAADTLGSLSTGLSTSAINKLSQMSVPELLAYSNLSQEIRIPVVHIESGQRFDNEKAPTLKNLDQWLKSNPKYNVDLLSLATSHPSLFSSSTSSAMPSSSGSRISTPKVSTAQKQHSSSAIDNTQKSLKAATTSLGTEKNDVAAANVSALSLSSSNASSVTQQLIEQAKKCSTTTAAAAAGTKDASGQTSTALPSSSYSASSLFGLGGGADFHGSGGACTSSTAAQMAVINQLLSGLAPTGVSAQTASQLQATNLAAATALATSAAAAAASTSCSSGGGSSHQHQSIKSIEQQMLLLQQTMALGGLGSSGGTSVINPYASFLYQNPADLFDIKSGQQQLFGGGTSSSISASALQSSAPQQQSSSSSVTSAEQQAIAALAAAAAAAGFPTMTSSVAAKGGSASAATADMNALSAAAALSSADLYLAAMASSFPPFLGGTGGAAMSNNLFQVNQQQQHQTSSITPSTAAALSSSSSLAGMNAALEQLFQAAGMDASALMMGLNTAATPAMPTPPYHQQQKGAAHQTSSTNSAGPSGIGDGSSNPSLFESSTKTVLTKVESAKTISLPLMASTIASSRQQQQRESPARKMGMTSIGGPKGLKLNAVLEKLNASSSSCSNSNSGVTTTPTNAAAMSNEQLQQQQQTEAVPSSVQPQKQERVEENSESSIPTELANQGEKIEPESSEIKQKVSNDEDNGEKMDEK